MGSRSVVESAPWSSCTVMTPAPARRPVPRTLEFFFPHQKKQYPWERRSATSATRNHLAESNRRLSAVRAKVGAVLHDGIDFCIAAAALWLDTTPVQADSPQVSRSTSATCIAELGPRIAATYPPGPPPRMIKLHGVVGASAMSSFRALWFGQWVASSRFILTQVVHRHELPLAMAADLAYYTAMKKVLRTF